MRIDKKQKHENNYNEPAHVKDEKKARREEKEKKRLSKLEEKTK